MVRCSWFVVCDSLIVKKGEKRMEKIKSYKDLRIWQMGVGLVKIVYDFTNKFPKSELYCLTSQIRRSAVSIPSNIAEGFLRHGTKEIVHFLYMALGSCGELSTQVEISSMLTYLNVSEKMVICEEIDHVSRMIRKLIKVLSSQTNHEPR